MALSSNRLVGGGTALEQYPLVITVPGFENARGTLGMRHTVYTVQVDDCGKTHRRFRRFSNFVWLHGVLQQRELECALPQLPPRRAIGRFDPAFVENRRRLLELYLGALLTMPAVIQDDSLWAFLDVDGSTFCLPRFLCRDPAAHVANADLLDILDRVASQEANVFRFCNQAVLKNLVTYAQAEAAEAAVTAPPAGQSMLQARLGNRVRLCVLVELLAEHNSARQGLIEVGMFGALLTLLRRCTEDRCAAPDTGGQLVEYRRNACSSATRCLQLLLERSKGAALLQFCQQDDGLTALHNLTTAEAKPLHAVAASLLWHGLQHSGVVTALTASTQRRGLKLLGSLLKSQDMKARLLAALCIGCIVRHQNALNEDEAGHCLQALEEEQITESLDAVEAEAETRAAQAKLENRNVGGSFVEATTRDPELVAMKRDPQLAAKLRELCSAKELARLTALLKPGDHVVLDVITAIVIAVFFHFVLQSKEEPARLKELRGLVPVLQRVVDANGDDEEEGYYIGAEVSGGIGSPATTAIASSALLEMQEKAAKINVRLQNVGGAENSGREPPTVAELGKRTSTLEVLTRHAETCQVKAINKLAQASEKGRMQSELVEGGHLTQAPVLPEERLKEFSTCVSHLAEGRARLAKEVDNTRRAAHLIEVSLDQRAVDARTFAQEVTELMERLASVDESRSQSAQVAVLECEARAQSAVAQVNARRRELREAQAQAQEAQHRAKEEQQRAAELARQEAELLEIKNKAPARLEALVAELEGKRREKAGWQARLHDTLAEGDAAEQRSVGLRDAEREAEAALQAINSVGSQLKSFRAELNSETVLTEAELERLQQLQGRLQPAYPSRLRRVSDADLRSNDWAEAAAMGSDGADTPPSPGSPAVLVPPSWDGARAEQEFQQSPNARTFDALFRERERLWREERQWLQAVTQRAGSTAKSLATKRAQCEVEERALADEEVKLRLEMKQIDDLEGHEARHREAQLEAERAHAAARTSEQEAAEAVGVCQLAETRLEPAQLAAQEADAALAQAREASSSEAERLLKVRTELEQRIKKLEAQAREYEEEWKGVLVEERRLELLQEVVDARMNDERESRAALRAQVQQLVEELGRLEQQLNVTDPVEVNAHWLQEAG